MFLCFAVWEILFFWHENVSLHNICCMLQDGHLKMLGGYLEFFMNRDLASTYLSLKSELENLIHCKVLSICSIMFYASIHHSLIWHFGFIKIGLNRQFKFQLNTQIYLRNRATRCTLFGCMQLISSQIIFKFIKRVNIYDTK